MMQNATDTKNQPGESPELQHLCHKVPDDLYGEMGTEGGRFFAWLSQFPQEILPFKGACVDIQAVSGAHRHTQKCWVA